MRSRSPRSCISVAPRGGISSAPQPFGRHIRQLEREVGKRLFERTSRRVALTPAGERLVAEARRVLAAVDGLAEVARADAPHDGAHPDLRYVPVEGPTCAAAIATRESDDRPGVAAFRRAARPLGGS
ncbi:LysR family transcriptional regulator [Nonomuraea sp. NPDC049480]|uniref:LysR family transcriptional regulator n=1 Tax=Nonomuraea sp. NPDC049480 TaxID=3364353 RepID=UPI0037B1EDD4